MEITITGYYMDELLRWDRSITMNYEEIEEIENRLSKVMRQNSTGDSGEQVYARQNLLNQAPDKFYNLRIEIQQQYIAFESHRLVGDALSDFEIEQRQVELRHTMRLLKNSIKM